MERANDEVLIALPPTDEECARLWQFPRGRVNLRESPEAAIRRIARDNLGLQIRVFAAPPPLVAMLNEAEVELRYLFCSILSGEPITGPYAEIRWVCNRRLCEYDYDPWSQATAAWLAAQT